MRVVARTRVFLLSVAAALSSGAHAQAPAAGDDEPKEHAAQPASLSTQQELDPPGYRDAVEHALKELAMGHFSEARAMFLRAHEIYPNARTLRGLGLAEFEERSYVDSIHHFEQALENPVRPLDAGQRAQTEELAARARGYVTRLDLSVTPKHAIVKIDGLIVDVTKQPVLLLNEGDHTLEAEAVGHRLHQRRLRALGGDVQHVLLALAPERTSPAGARDDTARPLRKNPWLWIGAGALVAGAAVTAALMATRERGSEPVRYYGGTADVAILGI